MHSLLPPQQRVDSEALADLYAYPAPQWVRANMVASLDGAATGPDGVSGSISTAVDKRVFGVLRGLADVILVGAGTVRAENYGPAAAKPAFAQRRRRLGQRDAPALAIVTASGDLDPSSPVFTQAPERTIVVTCASTPRRRRDALAGVGDVVVVGDGAVDLGGAIQALAQRGLTRVLCEGGPHLLAALAAADVLDELCLTWTPTLAGGVGPRVVVGPPIASPARGPWTLSGLIEEDSTLLSRWRLAVPAEPRSTPTG